MIINSCLSHSKTYLMSIAFINNDIFLDVFPTWMLRLHSMRCCRIRGPLPSRRAARGEVTGSIRMPGSQFLGSWGWWGPNFMVGLSSLIVLVSYSCDGCVKDGRSCGAGTKPKSRSCFHHRPRFSAHLRVRVGPLSL